VLTTSEDGPFCCDCKYLVGVRRNLENAKDWRCNHPKNILHKGYDPVSGIPVYIRKFESCNLLRERQDIYEKKEDATACCIVGYWYEEYVDPLSLYEESQATKKQQKQSLKNITADDL
jgi:hypothetical protein